MWVISCWSSRILRSSHTASLLSCLMHASAWPSGDMLMATSSTITCSSPCRSSFITCTSFVMLLMPSTTISFSSFGVSHTLHSLSAVTFGICSGRPGTCSMPSPLYRLPPPQVVGLGDVVDELAVCLAVDTSGLLHHVHQPQSSAVHGPVSRSHQLEHPPHHRYNLRPDLVKGVVPDHQIPPKTQPLL